MDCKNAPLKYVLHFCSICILTNLALSARELFTKYLNKIFIIKREIIDQKTGAIIERADYSQLDQLLFFLILITIVIPIVIIIIIQKQNINLQIKKKPPSQFEMGVNYFS